jgi:hypothetical protein
MYEFYSDANETVTIGASGVSARIDIICLKVDASTGVASIVAIAGTPSGSPAVPATPASHYKLAEVAVGAGVTTITNANITDTRRSVFIMPTGARNQGLINGKIVPTVASNNLTLAVKTLSDTDPSVTNPVGIWIGNQLRWITSALSVTANTGANILNSGSAELATQEIDYFAYIWYKTSNNTIQIGFARIPYARIFDNFDTSTGTNERAFIRSSTTGQTATDPVINIGRFAATLSASPSFNWSVPSFTNANLIQEPIYETRILRWTPTATGFSALPTDIFYMYKLTGTGIMLNIRERNDGTSNATTFTLTAPFECRDIGFTIFMSPVQVGNNSATLTTPGQLRIVGNSRTMDVFTNMASGAWTASGGKKLVSGTLFYEIKIE